MRFSVGSLSETAIFASNKYKVRHLATQGSKPAQKLINWLETPDKLLATLLLGNNFASIGAATVSAGIVSRYVFDPQALNIALAIETVAPESVAPVTWAFTTDIAHGARGAQAVKARQGRLSATIERTTASVCF